MDAFFAAKISPSLPQKAFGRVSKTTMVKPKN
jgi:hypothetical protein